MDKDDKVDKDDKDDKVDKVDTLDTSSKFLPTFCQLQESSSSMHFTLLAIFIIQKRK